MHTFEEKLRAVFRRAVDLRGESCVWWISSPNRTCSAFWAERRLGKARWRGRLLGGVEQGGGAMFGLLRGWGKGTVIAKYLISFQSKTGQDPGWEKLFNKTFCMESPTLEADRPGSNYHPDTLYNCRHADLWNHQHQTPEDCESSQL